MSLLNVLLSSDSATVYVDTEVVVTQDFSRESLRAGQTGHASKLLMLPSCNALIASRGTLGFLGLLACDLLSRMNDGFDALLTAAPKDLRACYETCRRLGETLALDQQTFEQQEIAYVGWSERLQRMTATVFLQESTIAGFEQLEIDGPWIGPWDDSWGCYPDPANDEAEVELAMKQVQLGRAMFPAGPLGGHLVRAKVRRHEFDIRQVCGL